MVQRLRRAVSRSFLAPAAIFPKRAVRIARHDARVLAVSARWLFGSREHHNYTYDLTKINTEHLAWYVSALCDAPVSTIKGYLAELATDQALRDHITTATAASARRGLADKQVRFARRAGWYAILRARRPSHVVETGVDKGLGTSVLAAALLRNAAEGHPGRVTAVDINPEAGYLVRSGPYAAVVDLVYNDSLQAIATMDRPIDVFLHDSDHSSEHERREFEAAESKLAPDALLLTDNVTSSNVLAAYADRTGRRFLAFTERPANHWYPGDGIGAAWRPTPA